MAHRAALSAFAVIAALGIAAVPTAAEDFYKGRTVTIMVPSGLGASMGLYGRMLAGALEKHIPGNPNVILESRPGAGGMTGTAFAYNAGPTDGTYIAMLSSGNVVFPILREMKFDPSKVQWLGSVAVRPSVIWLWHEAPVNTIDEARQTEVILGSTGAAGGTSIWPRMLNALIDTRFKIIEGYKGGASINQAAEQGEVHGRWTSYTGLTSSLDHWIRDGKIKLLLQLGPRIPEQEQVPSVQDLVTGDDLRIVRTMELSERVGMGFWFRPEVSKDRVAILREAMYQATHDPIVVEEAAKRNAPFDPISGEDIEKLVTEAYALPDDLRQRMRVISGIGVN